MQDVSNPLQSPVFLVIITAVGYLLATVGMKGVATGMLWTRCCVALVGFVAAFIAEVILMRSTDLSIVYILIVGVETVLVLAFATGIGEGMTLKQAMGAVLVMSGLALVAL